MTADSRPDSAPDTTVTFINVFEISAEHLDAFVARWEQRAALMRSRPGFIDSRLHRARSAEARFQLVNVSHWESQEAWEAAVADPEFRERAQAAQDDPSARITSSRGLYDVVVDLSAAEAEPGPE
ncbi:antibiotic biosynthesis monooxygenase family protein [Streptomyces pini]|uniref:Antibiotic biosynthesis monooxygenase n=1 Tax=Streptomyces pini TaxID=1520580 RepID=A0A1I3YJX2_9ACTN|nr:antibiotic biosynthesis monooxygenase family protein [Streptomyces pini]SFK32178.1 Antibiotic biosynthesis monooxygenase [Streptomyces pini]